MKNSKTCPKCQCKDVLRIPSPEDRSANLIGVSWVSAASVTRFLCTECGYSEEWVESKDDIDMLVKKFKAR